jgi:Ribonuclease G/E
MADELLISAGPGEWRAAWIEDGEAAELYVERGETKPAGSQHLGRVVQVVPALDAALIDIGDERPGFLPLRDLPDNITAEEGARIVVEVRREAWQDKAPRLTAKEPHLTAPADLEPPTQLFPASGLAAALALRLPAMPTRIVADDVASLAELRRAFPNADISHHPMGDWPIDLDALFDAALSPSWALDKDGAIHIEETRGATMIDVDTGTPALGSSARAALAANLAAARLIAKQLRLRNVSGALVIDFVGLDRRDHRERLRQVLEAALATDPQKPKLLGWTRLGHIELMRPRRHRSLADAMLQPGSRAKRPVAIACDALRGLQREARANPAANWRLSVPREVEAALRGAASDALRALETHLGRRILIEVFDGRDGFDIEPR